MFGIGGFELFLILLFGFLIFGPDKLPAMAKTLGKAINKFRSAQEEMNKVLKTEVYDPTSDEPFKNPLEALSKVGEIGKDDKEEKTESFSERKARYDKERAAKKAAEAEKAGAAETTATTAAAATATAAAAKPVAKPDGSFAKPEEPKAAETAKPAAKPESTAAKPKPSPDELYGTKPAAKKPATKPTAAKAAAASKSAAKPTAKTDAEKAAARSAAAKKAAATRAANRKAARRSGRQGQQEREGGVSHARRTGTNAPIRSPGRAPHAPGAHHRLPCHRRSRVLHGNAYYQPVLASADFSVSAGGYRWFVGGHDRARSVRGVCDSFQDIDLDLGRCLFSRYPMADSCVLSAGAQAERAQVVRSHVCRGRELVYIRHDLLLSHYSRSRVSVADGSGCRSG